jgi:hypothetical protein
MEIISPLISYHPDQKNIGRKERYYCNFRAVDTDDPHRIANAITRFVISPIVFKDGYDRWGKFRKGYRHTSCFVSANWIGLDFDEGPSLTEMTKVFCDVRHVIGTTKSHQIPKGSSPACDRFRILLQLPLTITDYLEYREIMRYYVSEYDADQRCKDAARFFWPCKEVTSIFDDEDTIEVKKLLPEERHYDDDSHYQGSRDIPPWIQHKLKFGVAQGAKNDECYKIGIWLTKAGFSCSEIVDMIMKSPIPNQHAYVYEEVCKTVSNGAKRANNKKIEELSHEFSQSRKTHNKP